MSNQEILPCPFCGKKDVVTMTAAEIEDINEFELPDDIASQYEHSFAVLCSFSDGGCGGTGAYRPSEKEAVAVWNRRTLTPTQTAAPELLEALLGLLQHIDFVTDECLCSAAVEATYARAAIAKARGEA